MAKAESSVFGPFVLIVLFSLKFFSATSRAKVYHAVEYVNSIDDVSLSVSQQEFLTKKVRYVGTYVKQL